MRVRALKTTHGSYGTLPRGRVAEIDDYEAKDMISLGYMIEVLPLDKQEAAPKADNDNIPFDAAHQTGSQTGAEVPQLSLRADQAQPRQALSEPEADSVTAGKSTSSPSTTDTNSAHGQMHSTPATTTGGKRKRGRLSSKG